MSDELDDALRNLDRLLALHLPQRVAAGLMDIANEVACDNTMRLEVAIERFAALLPEEVRP